MTIVLKLAHEDELNICRPMVYRASELFRQPGITIE